MKTQMLLFSFPIAILAAAGLGACGEKQISAVERAAILGCIEITEDHSIPGGERAERLERAGCSRFARHDIDAIEAEYLAEKERNRAEMDLRIRFAQMSLEERREFCARADLSDSYWLSTCTCPDNESSCTDYRKPVSEIEKDLRSKLLVSCAENAVRLADDKRSRANGVASGNVRMDEMLARMTCKGFAPEEIAATTAEVRQRQARAATEKAKQLEDIEVAVRGKN